MLCRFRLSIWRNVSCKALAVCLFNMLLILGMLLASLRSLAAPARGVPALPATASADIRQGSGTIIVVTSPADSGPGTLRQALLDAQSGDTITFDLAVFPPTAPVTITLTSALPELTQGDLTIDASDAGVILDGSNIGTTPETLLLDDVSLTLNGGPNLITNGDFSAGLGHWRPFDEGSGATRSLNSSDFHSSPQSYAWTTVAQAGEGRTAYDTTDTSEPFADWPYQAGSTVWMPATGGSTAELRFWYRYGGVGARLHALFPDGHVEQISDWWFDPAANWTEAVASQVLPADTVGIALELDYDHSELGVSGLSIVSNGNTIRGLQILHFPTAGIALSGGAQNNTIGGDRGIGAGLLGQGNLLSGNGGFGVGLWGADTSFNTIIGNYIGTDLSGTTAWGIRRDGIHINGASHNQIIDNLISGNGQNGVYICCGAESNTVRGNHIGTDASGLNAVGNLQAGVTIDQGARDNVIGPDNVIAYNGIDGVGVHSSDALGNTITRNSIHDNAQMGIELWDGGNAELAAPLIFDFDLAAGTVAGTACGGCTVELFSDSSDEGEAYEGLTTADGAGQFTFSKAAPLTGPHLTATATDAAGNTSEFSRPTSGTRQSTILQDGNSLPRTRLQPKRSGELADNRIGGYIHGLWTIPESQFEEMLQTQILDLGWKRMRVAINALDWDLVDWSKPEFYIDPTHDNFISSLADNGITITYVLTFWDKATWPGGEGANCPRFKTEDEIQRYLDFVRFIVRHFKDRIQYFEMWNEPETPFCPQWIEVDDYINLVRRTVPVIRQEYPEAKIEVGTSDIHEYLFPILRSDIMPLVDVVAWHPFYGHSPEYDSQYYYEYPSIVQEIKDLASAHGFTGEYEADEMTYRSPECFWCNPNDPIYSSIVSAKYYARGIVMHLGMDVTAGVGGMSSLLPVAFPTVQNLCTIMAGAQPASLPAEIQSQATNIRSYGFSLPNGDRLFALWTDGAAVDNDPGVPATLTFNGFSDHRVTGIDVLHGFEQQLITSQEDGNLVIRDLLVKDYPIILRLTPTRYVFLPIVVR